VIKISKTGNAGVGDTNPTGVGGFPVEECAAVMLAAASDFVDANPRSQILKIVFVLFNQLDYDVFSRALTGTGSQ